VANHHGSLVLVGDRGVLITGPSGSGKSTLALALLRHCNACGVFARLVGDDQVFLAPRHGRLVGRAAPVIRGLIEAHGLGPSPVRNEEAAVVDHVVRLVPAADAPRYQDGESVVMETIALPCLNLAQRNAEAGVWAIAARLLLPPLG
jgi:serine kinase of HPr protein (carbohydrate metabolism regulator)